MFHNPCQLAWQGTELQRVYADTGMLEMNRPMGVYRDPGLAEMDGVTGSLFSADPRVDRLHFIL